MNNTPSAEGLPELPQLPEPRLRPFKHLDTVYYNAAQMKDYARAYGELCRRAASPAEGRMGEDRTCLFDATNPCDGTCGECHHLASPADSPATLGEVIEAIRDEMYTYLDREKIPTILLRGWGQRMSEALRALDKKLEGRAVDDSPKTIVVSSGDMCFTADWDGEYFVTRSPIKLDDSATPPEVGGGRG